MTIYDELMVDINPSIRPQRIHFTRFMVRREARALKIFVKWSHEDPFITPTLGGVLNKVPGWNLFTKIVS